MPVDAPVTRTDRGSDDMETRFVVIYRSRRLRGDRAPARLTPRRPVASGSAGEELGELEEQLVDAVGEGQSHPEPGQDQQGRTPRRRHGSVRHHEPPCGVASVAGPAISVSTGSWYLSFTGRISSL